MTANLRRKCPDHLFYSRRGRRAGNSTRTCASPVPHIGGYYSGRSMEKKGMQRFKLACFILLSVLAGAFFSYKQWTSRSFRKAEALHRVYWRQLLVGRTHSLLHASNMTRASKSADVGGIAVVAACSGRHSNLKSALESWLNVREINEVILVDWGSNAYIEVVRGVLSHLAPRPQDVAPTAVVLVHAPDEHEWNLSRAFNLAVSMTKVELILKLDCDHVISPDFVEVHRNLIKSMPSTVVRGNYTQARNVNERHLHGAFFMKRDMFLDVGGYDERIRYYGYEDEDLYYRLIKLPTRQITMDLDKIQHIQHGDELRIQASAPCKIRGVLGAANRIFLSKLAAWDKCKSAASTYHVTKRISMEFGEYVRVATAKKMDAGEDFDADYEAAVRKVLERTFLPRWALSPRLTKSISTKDIAIILEQLIARSTSHQPSRLLVVHVMHGLGNRLKALLSAVAFARRTNRYPVIIWNADEHCNATFQELFQAPSPKQLLVASHLPTSWPLSPRMWENFDVYNYMETDGFGAAQNEYVRNNRGFHIYIKTAYLINSSIGTSELWSKLRTLSKILVPVERVAMHVEKCAALDWNNTVAVHIRSQSCDDEVNLAIDYKRDYSSQGTKQINHWRQKSSVHVFIREMSRLLLTNPALQFYVAADNVRTIRQVEEHFPYKVASLDRSCDSRDSKCMEFALADMLCLSKAHVLLGSGWSTFTQMAHRFAQHRQIVRIAGVNF